MHIEVHLGRRRRVPVTMKSVEDQGSFKILTVALSGHTLRARVPEGIPFRKIRPG
jgi:ABC-type sugar transport system ATPase subunit